MLIDSARSPQRRTLALQLGNEGLRLFLEALLSAWAFTLTDNPAGAQLCLAEEGGPPPLGDTPVLWLTPCASSAADRLVLPLAVDAFARALEEAFHSPPRSHLRSACPLPLQLEARGVTSQTRLQSFSDHGARFLHNRELAPGEELRLRFALLGSDYDLAAQTIYSFAQNGHEAAPSFATGVIFTGLGAIDRALLRDQIVTLYLQQLRSTLPPWAYTVGLSAFRCPERFRFLIDP